VILSKGVDTGLIDGLVNGSGRLIEVFSRGARRLQTGVAQSYALAFVAGIILILALLVFR
jgi:NADH-quinone oxidoreductase subunit L